MKKALIGGIAAMGRYGVRDVEDPFTGWRRRVRLALVKGSRNRGQIDGVDSYDPSSHSVRGVCRRSGRSVSSVC
jgi:hypothetical protein